MPLVEDRLDTLSTSVTLLSDTTESCFKALSMQLQFLQLQGGLSAPSPAPSRLRAAQAAERAAEPGIRKGRQRRVVGAERRGEALAAIAAREDVAEGEVALRLHLNREAPQAAESKRYGSMLS